MPLYRRCVLVTLSSLLGIAPAGTWVRVELTFGPDLVLCVDGEPASWEGTVPYNKVEALCTTALQSGGIEQTDTDWLLGATNWCQPVTDIPALPMKGAIDELGIEEVAPGP